MLSSIFRENVAGHWSYFIFLLHCRFDDSAGRQLVSPYILPIRTDTGDSETHLREAWVHLDLLCPVSPLFVALYMFLAICLHNTHMFTKYPFSYFVLYETNWDGTQGSLCRISTPIYHERWGSIPGRPIYQPCVPVLGLCHKPSVLRGIYARHTDRCLSYRQSRHYLATPRA